MWISKKNLNETLAKTVQQLLNGKLSGVALGDIVNLSDKVVSLTQEKTALTESVEKLKMERRIEEQELKHLVKMKEEKDALEKERMEVRLTANFQAKEMGLQKEYFEKTMENVERAKAEINTIYREILNRLPNVTALITKDVQA